MSNVILITLRGWPFEVFMAVGLMVSIVVLSKFLVLSKR